METYSNVHDQKMFFVNIFRNIFLLLLFFILAFILSEAIINKYDILKSCNVNKFIASSVFGLGAVAAVYIFG